MKKILKQLSLILILMVLSIPSAFAVSKSESQYTGPPLLEHSKNAGHWLGVAAKCNLGSKYDIRDEVGKLSWEDYKKFNSGYSQLINLKQKGAKCRGGCEIEMGSGLNELH